MRELVLNEIESVSGGQDEGLNRPVDPQELSTEWTVMRDIFGLSDAQITAMMLSSNGNDNAASALLLCESGHISEFTQNDSSSASGAASAEGQSSVDSPVVDGEVSVIVSGSGSAAADAGWSVICK